MSSVSKAIIVGRLGKDPEVRYSADGMAFANISVATDHRWNDKASGEEKKETEWHNVVLRGRTAEVAKEHLKKGSQVYVEGRVRTRKWQDKDVKDRYTTEVLANSMQMLGNPMPQQEPKPAPKAPSAGGPGISDEDDIPF